MLFLSISAKSRSRTSWRRCPTPVSYTHLDVYKRQVYNEDGSLNLNPHSLEVKECFMEPSLKEAKPYESFQFVRQGFFCCLLYTSLEGLALENVDELNEKIGQLQAKGFRVSLDDFGSGYSSMNTLGRLKINELKLDKEFLLNVSGQELERNCMIMEQIIHMARQLCIFTVAEGVETEEDEQLIRSVGCDVGQGYFYSRPISVEEFNETYMCKADKQVLEAASIPE